MLQNMRAVVRYDGTNFSGWQVQPNVRTVQGEIERVLSKIAGEKVHIHGSGRTDAGVHALGQVFSFHWPKPHELEKLRRAVSYMVGPEIRIVSLDPAPDTFHAQYDARGKRYAYSLCGHREPDPFTAHYAWHLEWDVDRHYVHALAQHLVGEHDFAGFQGGKAATKTSVRTIYSIVLREGGLIGPADADNLWRLEFDGNGFLYKMVRNIVGTLVDIARGRYPESRLFERLNSSGPFQGHTAPPQGLALLEVHY